MGSDFRKATGVYMIKPIVWKTTQWKAQFAFTICAVASTCCCLVCETKTVDHELPMNPITAMRNGLGVDQGGSGKPIDVQEYVIDLSVVYIFLSFGSNVLA